MRDSVDAVLKPAAALTTDVTKRIETIDYASLKDSVAKLMNNLGGGNNDLATILNAVGKSRPELYFKLVEDMPDKKELLFDAIDSRAAVKKLKSVETNSVAKKEFLKNRKENTWFLVRTIGISVAGAALLTVAAIALF
jgi:hypothetical protein